MEIIQKLGSLPIFILMFVIIYFVMIRPQSVQQKKHQSLLLGLKKGDKILTRGGVTGKVIDIKGKNKDRVQRVLNLWMIWSFVQVLKNTIRVN